MDFFLWGFVKDQVFVPTLPANVVELRTRITAAVAKVTPEMLRSVWQETDFQSCKALFETPCIREAETAKFEVSIAFLFAD